MPDQKHFEPGEDAFDFTLADYRGIVRDVKAYLKPPVAAPLEWADDTLHLAFVEGFYAKLTGPMNPYGMVEQYRKPDGTFAKRVRMCDACAYEVNDVVALDDKIIWLQPGAPGEYVGQWIANGAAHPPPACPLTIHLRDCDGSPIQGATVTIMDCPSFRTPIVGTTDASGNYTFPPNTPIADGGISTMNCYTIAWDGIVAGPFVGIPTSSVSFCSNYLNFCYRHARVTVNTTADPTTDLSFPLTPFTRTGAGTGTLVLTYKNINFCSYPSLFPIDLPIQVSADNSKYLDNCTTLTVNCGDDVTVSLPLFEWDTDYALHSFSCDEGCAARGEGPNYRGITPKNLFVTISPVTLFGAQYLGNYAGVTIPVTWNGSFWDSGCLPNPNIRCDKANIYSPVYGSARVTITVASGAFTINFVAYSDLGCTPGAGVAPCDRDEVISAGIPATVCTPYFYSPLDVTLNGHDSLNTAGFYFHVTE